MKSVILSIQRDFFFCKIRRVIKKVLLVEILTHKKKQFQRVQRVDVKYIQILGFEAHKKVLRWSCGVCTKIQITCSTSLSVFHCRYHYIFFVPDIYREVRSGCGRGGYGIPRKVGRPPLKGRSNVNILFVCNTPNISVFLWGFFFVTNQRALL